MFFKKKPNDDQVEITTLLLATGLYESGETVNSVGLADLITSSMKKFVPLRTKSLTQRSQKLLR